ncbi:hypothetical protein IRZ83_17585 [Flavobacterium sp. JLP]|uniref:hypothetical protein n=1 Tax=Flavobacterium sp. JLP TaxID=2783793 RepID=UPI001889E795|nr:hypothetical protein [Flavobacterium sp. JLP]MBF4508492.1 hypothetical protein [Flavobacterium sp. JLP]
MTSTLRNLILVLISTFFFSNSTNAQPRKGKFINITAGLGITASDYEEDNVELDGSGFYAQGEYVWGITKWFGLRPYAGVIFTSPAKNTNTDQPDYKISTKAFLLGGKARICAPIPWIAPFIETGFGASIGSFETYTPSTNIKKSGIVTHVPFSFGLALGPKHNIEAAFTYYYQSSVDQFCGAVAVGYSFPID